MTFLELDNFTLQRYGQEPVDNALDAMLIKNELLATSTFPVLRDYQTDSVRRTEHALKYHKAVCLQSATGSGKSVMLGEIARIWPGKIWWLTHRKELVKQSSSHLQRAKRYDAEVTSPIKYWNRVQSRTFMPSSADLLIVDEAHHASAQTWARAIKHFPGSVLGATATPWRLSKKEGLDHIFDFLVCGPQVSELIAYGYLSDCQVKIPALDKRVQGAGDTGGDFSELATWNANERNIMVNEAIDWLDLHDPDRSIIYACGEEHARTMLEYIKETNTLKELAGKKPRKAALLTAKTEPKERERIESAFRKGSIDTMLNIMIATEGFDVPECDAVLLTRPTKSLALYLQMVGRALRPKGYPATILDCCAMSLEHGLPADDRAWTLKPRGENKPGKAWPMPDCGACGTVNHPMQKFCAGCGLQRWHTCEDCSKPVFHEDGPNTPCQRCFRESSEYVKELKDDEGKPIWCLKRDRPILGYVRLRDGYSSWAIPGKKVFGGVWKHPDHQTADLLAPGTVVSLLTTAGKTHRKKIVEFENHAPFGQVYVLNSTLKQYEETYGKGARPQ